MGVQRSMWFPYQTVPEVTEQFAQSVLTETSSYKKFPLGTQRHAYHTSFGAWGRFRYVKIKIAARQGAVVAYSAASHVTCAPSAANSKLRAGVCCGVTTAVSQFGWIQVEGPNFFKVETDKGIAAGDMCIKDEATAQILDTMAQTVAGTQIGWVGFRAIAADSGSHMAIGKLIIGLP